MYGGLGRCRRLRGDVSLIMSKPFQSVLITRPSVDAARTAERAQSLGLGSRICPLLEIEPVDLGGLRVHGAQASVFTSANGVRAVAASSVLRDLVGLPAFAVGPTTAHLMKQAGFIDVRQGGGNATALTALIRKETNAVMGRLFYFAGRVHSPAMAAELTSAGFAVETIIAYDAAPSQAGVDALSAHLNSYQHAEEAVLLYSPRAATIFSDTVLSGQLGSALISRWAFSLSDAVRQPITNLPFKRSLVSSDQNERALFSLIESYL